jgi:hypothetical protein
MISKDAVFLISVATEKFIERLTQAGQRVAERQSRATVLERDICEHRNTTSPDSSDIPAQVRWCAVRKNSLFFGASAHPFPRVLFHKIFLDVLNEPDDSYPIHETKKTRKAKNTTDPSEGIGAFFSKPPAPVMDSEEDVVMKDSGPATAGVESTNE